MLSHLSSNVASAKARVMYEHKLTTQNYREMLNYKNVTEIAQYLATNTDYNKVLAGINDREVYHGQLENRLKQKLLVGSVALCRYKVPTNGTLAAYLLQRSEVDQILNALLHLNADRTKEYLSSMPAALAARSHIDPVRLSGADNFDSTIVALAHMPYQMLLESFRPTYDNPTDFTAAENALDIYLYSQLYETTEHLRYKGVRQDLRQVVDLYLDPSNLAHIPRLKTYFQVGSGYIHSDLLPSGSFNKNQIKKMIQVRGAGEVCTLLAKTRIGRRASKIEYNSANQLAERALYNACRRGIHFSVYASVVMLPYIFYLQIELMGIINIVEGIRYHLLPEETKKLPAFSGF